MRKRIYSLADGMIEKVKENVKVRNIDLYKFKYDVSKQMKRKILCS